MASPVVQAQIEEFLAERKDRARQAPRGFTKEELVEFLREHGERLDHRWGNLDSGALQVAATEPDDLTKSRVYDRLIDLHERPLQMGREDPFHPGIFQVRVTGTDVIALFDFDAERQIVDIASIFEDS